MIFELPRVLLAVRDAGHEAAVTRWSIAEAVSRGATTPRPYPVVDAPLVVDAETAGPILGVTPRTARRLLRTLVEEGLAWPLPSNRPRTSQPGRPRELYKLNPDTIHQATPAPAARPQPAPRATPRQTKPPAGPDSSTASNPPPRHDNGDR